MRALIAAVLLVIVATAAATSAMAAPKDRGPQWASLNVDQQQALAPLAGEWDKLSKPHKTKWLGIAKRYPAMKPEEQKRVQDRMRRNGPSSRRSSAWQAREQYRSIGKIAPDRRREELHRYWAMYQALPPHEKRMFDVPPDYMPPAERRHRPAPATAKARPHHSFVLPAPL